MKKAVVEIAVILVVFFLGFCAGWAARLVNEPAHVPFPAAHVDDASAVCDFCGDEGRVGGMAIYGADEDGRTAAMCSRCFVGHGKSPDWLRDKADDLPPAGAMDDGEVDAYLRGFGAAASVLGWECACCGQYAEQKTAHVVEGRKVCCDACYERFSSWYGRFWDER